MGAVRISIGAALDASFEQSLAKAEQRAAKAGAKMRDAAGRFTRDQVAGAEAAAAKQSALAEKQAAAYARANAKANAEIARAEAALTAQAERNAAKRSAAAMREFDARLRASKRARDAEERDILRVAAAAERADARREAAGRREAQQKRSAFGREMGNRSVANLGQAARFGMGVAGSVARGAGVDLDVGNAVSRNVELQTRAVELSNLSAEYKPDGTSTRVSEGEITSNVKAAADANAFSRTETMGGLHQFAAKTGDLQTGMAILKDMGALSRATGTELGDMVAAAGDVSVALENMGVKGEAKVKALKSTMATFAGQGKEAAVEMKDLASQMAKLSSSATGFEGAPEDILAMMGTFAQMSRQAGGSASSTQAATSVQGLVNTLKTPARVKAFEKEGISVVNKETGLLRNPQEIIKAALAKTEGDPTRMKSMFANIVGARTVGGFANQFLNARANALKGGATQEDATTQGLAAVQAQFDKFNSAKLGQREIDEASARSMGTDAAKVQKFQNKLDDVAANMQAKLLPALERSAPAIVKFAETLSGWIADAAESPGKALAIAIGASIAKAGIETVISNGIAGLFSRAAGALSPAGGATGKGATAGSGGGMGKLGSALTIATAAIAIEQVGEMAIDSLMDDKDREDDQARSEETKHFNLERTMKRAQAGEPLSEREKGDLASRRDELNSRIEMAKGVDGSAGEWLWSAVRGEGSENAQYNADRENLDSLRMELAQVKDAMGGNKDAVNASAEKIVAAIRASAKGGGPSVDPGGRQPLPGSMAPL